MPKAGDQRRERWRPPRGRHRLPPEVIARSQRERLLEAAVRVVAEKGYGPTTVADLTREAGISRTTFYAMFDDKEGCFLAAYDGIVDALVRRIDRRLRGRGGVAAASPRRPCRAARGTRRGARGRPPGPGRCGRRRAGGAAALPGGAAAADAVLRRGARFRPRRPQPASQHVADGDRRRRRADLRRARRRPSGTNFPACFRTFFLPRWSHISAQQRQPGRWARRVDKRLRTPCRYDEGTPQFSTNLGLADGFRIAA